MKKDILETAKFPEFRFKVTRIEGIFNVPYVEWGMKDPSNFLFKVEKLVAAGHIKH